MDTYIFGSGSSPASKPIISRLADGGFIVVWHAPDDGGLGAWGQRLDQFGQQVGSEFRVNATQTTDQVNPFAVGLPDGGFVVVWRSTQGGDNDIYGVRYDYLGNKSFGPEFRVNTVATGNQLMPSGWYMAGQTSDQPGKLMIGWTTVNATGPGSSAWYREFNDYNGTVNPVGAEKMSIQWTDNFIRFSRSVVALEGSDGYFARLGTGNVPPYTGDPQQGQNWTDLAAMVRVADNQGRTIGSGTMLETLVNGGSYSATDHIHSYAGGAAALPNGGFVAVWTQWDDTSGASTVYAHGFSHTGVPTDATTIVAQNAKHAAVTKLADGNIAVAWADTQTDSLQVKVFQVGGTPLTTAFALPDTYQYQRPSLAPTADGGFIVTAEYENSVPLVAIVVTPLDLLKNPAGGKIDVSGSYTDTGGSSNLVGGSGNDRIDAGVGNDVLNGGAGADTLIGGSGDDLYIIGAGDTLEESSGTDGGTDTVLVTDLTSFTLPQFFEILEYKGSSSFTGTGNEADNEIKTGAGTDTLAGGTGNDTLSSGGGDDKLDGGNGSNLMDGGTGSDTALLTGKISDFGVTIIKIGSKTPFTLNGASAEDIVTLTSGNGRVDRMVHVEKVQFDGDGGGTSFDVSGTSTTLSGARTVKVARYLSDDDSKNSLVGTAKNEAIDGLDGDDTLKGNAGNDALFGRGGIDALEGGTGDDTLDGGVGADILTGGTGKDIYIIDADDAKDTIVETATGGVDTVSTSLTVFSLAAGGASSAGNVEYIELLEHAGDTDFTGTGNTLANVIISGAGHDSLDGGAGNDKLDGKAGNDTLNGGAGVDILIGGAGDDVYLVDRAASSYIDGAGNTILVAGDTVVEIDSVTKADSGGTDTIKTSLAGYSMAAIANVEHLSYTGTLAFTGTGNTLNNSITGGAGNDKLNGGKGDDILTGGAGNDTLMGGDAVGFVGTDTVVLSGNLADYLFSRVSDDKVTLNRVVAVTHKTTGEKDTLTGIEKVVFADIAGGRLLNSLPKSDTQTDDGLLLNSASPFNDTYLDDETKTTDNDFDGGAGDDTITGGTAVNTLTGGLGMDKLSGGAGNDVLSGGDGNDVLDGGTGDDTLTGGKGDDSYVVDAANDVVTENALEGTDTIRTSLTSYSLADKAAQAEKLIFTGTAAATGTGNDLNNTINGNAGNDSLDGRIGADKLIGGAGDDTYVIDRATLVLADGTVVAGDSVVELTGEGTDTIKTSLASYSLAALANVENLIYDKGTGAIDVAFTGTGNDANNNLTGGAGNDKLNGGKGDDILTGGAGNDTLMGGDAVGFVGTDTVVLSGNLADYLFSRVSDDKVTLNRIVAVTHKTTGEKDTLTGIEKVVFADIAGGRLLNSLPKSDTQTDDGLLLNSASPFNDTYLDDETKTTDNDFDGGAGDDTITGGTAVNTLTGGLGMDKLSGGAGNDVLSGGDGNDVLDGGTGDDTLTGGKGDDSYVVDAANDVVTENALEGTDTIRTSLTSYSLADKAAQAEKLIFTGTAAATGTGNDLNNTINGGTGNDSLVGGLGLDTLLGGDGNDTLDGGDGADRLEGGAGNDTYIVDRPADLVKETDATGSDLGGTDTVSAQTAGSYVLPVYVENFVFAGTGNVIATGNATDNPMSGSDGNDILYGLAGVDSLSGNAGNDTLNGGLGDDSLDGGAGNDRLIGGAGLDHFRFTTALDASANVETIADFGYGGVNDAIDLGSSIFSSALFNGLDLNPSFFYKGTTAQLSSAPPVDERILYDMSTGQLWYDADGAGDAVRVLFATIAGNKAALAATDFHLVT